MYKYITRAIQILLTLQHPAFCSTTRHVLGSLSLSCIIPQIANRALQCGKPTHFLFPSFLNSFFRPAASSAEDGFEKINLFNAIYFTIVTFSTVGYGDITPTGIVPRLWVMGMIVLGLIVLPAEFQRIAVTYARARANGGRYKGGMGHHVVLIAGSLSAENARGTCMGRGDGQGNSGRNNAAEGITQQKEQPRRAICKSKQTLSKHLALSARRC